MVDVRLGPGKLTVWADKPGGISLAECTELNRELRQVLDPEGFADKEVEVGSPGPGHPLQGWRQFNARIGKKLRVTLETGAEVSGRLVKADEEGFEMDEMNGKTDKKQEKNNHAPARRFAFGEVRDARVLYEL